jgi:hypothetical protein
MAYRVSLSGPAETDAYAAFERIREAAPPRHAEKWLTRLFAAILSLDTDPARCAVIREAPELGFPAPHLLYGRGRGGTESSFTSARMRNNRPMYFHTYENINMRKASLLASAAISVYDRRLLTKDQTA